MKGSTGVSLGVSSTERKATKRYSPSFSISGLPASTVQDRRTAPMDNSDCCGRCEDLGAAYQVWLRSVKGPETLRAGFELRLLSSKVVKATVTVSRVRGRR